MSIAEQKRIFMAALDLSSASERREYLAQACRGNDALRAAVEGLLATDASSTCLVDLGPPPLTNLRAYLDPADGVPGGTADDVLHDRTGELVGHYRLLEKIGEGGFGQVYVAQQEEPVRRRVAVKLLKPGLNSRGILARFEAERQALALMNHPHIAQVFDAGLTSTGEPFFAMELVRGVPITEFCENHQLDIRERLMLFVDVCHAVQHAHQKGVIHRDLKPPNVLVTLHDAKPVVKVIDFGVAKALNEPLTDRTIYTRFMEMVGTPMYMSPEQAEMNSLDVDTRSDVFSLGMLLFENLTGSTPYDADRLNHVSFDELRRIIREERLPSPSRRLTTMGARQSTVSSHRRTTPVRLQSELRGDLDWIVMKATDKDRSRRYESASALARDIQQYLDHRPIEARPPSTWYLFTRFARRNKVTLVAGSLVLMAMIVGTAVSTWQAYRVAKERDEKDRAREQAVEARDAVEKFAERLKEANGLMASGRAHADAGLWRAAAADYDRAIQIQPNYYFVWVERGAFYVRLGLWEEASADYSKAVQLSAPVSGPEWWGGAQLLLLANDERAYRTLCKQMWSESLSDEHNPSVWALRSCLFSEDSPIAMDEIAAIADHLPQWDHRRSSRPAKKFSGIQVNKSMDRHPEGVRHYVVGLVHYRTGRFADAVSELRQAQDIDQNWAGKPATYPALAMALFRLGQQDEARTALADANRRIETWVDSMLASEVGTMPMPWFDYIEGLLLYREANTLITGRPLDIDPRQLTLRERARRAIR